MSHLLAPVSVGLYLAMFGTAYALVRRACGRIGAKSRLPGPLPRKAKGRE